MHTEEFRENLRKINKFYSGILDPGPPLQNFKAYNTNFA
jgi:hypothetical protein